LINPPFKKLKEFLKRIYEIFQESKGKVRFAIVLPQTGRYYEWLEKYYEQNQGWISRIKFKNFLTFEDVKNGQPQGRSKDKTQVWFTGWDFEERQVDNDEMGNFTSEMIPVQEGDILWSNTQRLISDYKWRTLIRKNVTYKPENRRRGPKVVNSAPREKIEQPFADRWTRRLNPVIKSQLIEIPLRDKEAEWPPIYPEKWRDLTPSMKRRRNYVRLEPTKKNPVCRKCRSDLHDSQWCP
jgi:hypothetical protein